MFAKWSWFNFINLNCSRARLHFGDNEYERDTFLSSWSSKCEARLHIEGWEYHGLTLTISSGFAVIAELKSVALDYHRQPVIIFFHCLPSFQQTLHHSIPYSPAGWWSKPPHTDLCAPLPCLSWCDWLLICTYTAVCFTYSISSTFPGLGTPVWVAGESVCKNCGI